MSKQIIIKIIFFFTIILLKAQKYDIGCYVKDPNARYREHNVDFTKLNLDLNFIPKDGLVNGLATYSFKILNPLIDTVFLDAINMNIEKVSIQNIGDISYKVSKAGLTLDIKKILPPQKSFNPAQEYILVIQYKAYPKKGLYFIGWNDSFNLSQKQIWSQGQGIDNRHWIPGFDDQDDKLVTSLTVAFDKQYEVISNGLFKESNTNPKNSNEKLWKFEMTQPHALYLIMLAIGNYKYKDLESKSGVISRQYYYPERESSFHSTYQYSNEMMNWMEDEIKIPYAWNKFYRNVPVQDFMFGAMENTTATIFTDIHHQDPRAAFERNYIATNAHELAHQWFGDLITAWSGNHHWLHESFATHYSKHFIKHQFGLHEFEKTRLEEMNASIDADKGNNFPIAHSEAGSSKHYPKGSIVLDMMRYVLGNENYRRSIEAYLKKHSFKNVDSHDLYISILETTGINLDWFFDEWVYRSSNPNISTSYFSKDKKITFYSEQKMDSFATLKPFMMPVELEVFYKNGSKDSSVRWISKIQDTFTIDNPNNLLIDYILFDGRNQILKRYKPLRSMEEIIAQIEKSPYPISKFEAVNALSDTAISKKKALLISVFNKEDFIPLKTTIMNQLGKDTVDTEIQIFLLAQLKSNNHFIRREAMQLIKLDNQKKKNSMMENLKDTSYNNIKIAMDKLAKTYPKESLIFANKTRPLTGFNRNIEIGRHKIIIQYQKSMKLKNYDKNIDSLIFFASKSFEFRTRTNAIETLSDLEILNTKYLPILFDAYLNANSRLSGPAHTVLKKSLKNKDQKILIDDFYTQHKWDEFQLDKLKALMNP